MALFSSRVHSMISTEWYSRSEGISYSAKVIEDVNMPCQSCPKRTKKSFHGNLGATELSSSFDQTLILISTLKGK